MSISPCPNCQSQSLYASDPIGAGGGYAPNYLPGLGGKVTAAKFRLVVCTDCGLTRFFASPEALEKLPRAKKWHPM